MVARFAGRDAVSARQLALETGLRQQTLSRWLQEASRVPVMPARRPTGGRDYVPQLNARLSAPGLADGPAPGFSTHARPSPTWRAPL
jgi:hypothetical protein